MAFTTLVLFQLFNVLNARSDERSAFQRLFRNRWLWGALLLSWRSDPGGVRAVLATRIRYRGSEPRGLARVLAVASWVLWLRELSKLFVSKR